MNNYAVSSDGLATALQDSASALMSAGNNLEQSVALVASANKVVQDPSSVGSALRTIALRIRGTSTEVLQELGEETDGVVESVSKLQSKVKALSGVNILDDTGAYKDTYTILKEIGQVWEDMSDIDQAALLELLAGKNRANTLSAILSNMEDLGGAYESALNAEGSAMRENEAYLDSIQGRIDLFTNSWQTMWMNLIESDTIKDIVDLGTSLVELADDIGVVNIAFTALAMRMSAKYFKVDFAQWFNVKNLKHPIKSIKDWFKTIEGGSTAAQNNLDALTKSYEDAKNAYELNPLDQNNLNAYNAARVNLETYQQTANEAIKASNNLKKAQENLANAQNRLNNYTGNSQKELYKLQDGVKRAQKGVEDATEATKKFEQSGSKSFANVGEKVENFVGQVQSVVASMLVMYAITKIIDLIGDAFDKNIETAEEAKQSFDDLTSELSNTKSSLKDLESELSNIEDQIIEINQNAQLSFTDKEELNRLKAESEELKRQIEYTELLEKQQQFGVNQSAVNAAEQYKQTGTKTGNTASENIGSKAGSGALIGAGIGTVAVGSAAAGIGTAVLGAKAGTAIGTAIAPVIGTLIGAAVGAIAGAAVGVVVGGIQNTTEETIGETMDNMTENYNRLQSEMETAREKYIQSGNKKDQEKYEEALEAFNKYQSEMATYMTEMDSIYSQMDWDTATEEERKAMQEFYNQRDKWAITSGAQGAEVTALDRIFGENASEEIQAIEDQITEAIENGEAFDFEKAVESSQELKDTLEYIGLDTEDVKDYFTQIGEEANKAQEATSILSSLANTLDSIQSKYDTLQGAIDEFNERGAISGETLKSLIDNDLLQYLTFTENGLIADANAMQMLEQAAINEAYAMLNTAMVQDMENYALGKTEQMSSLAQNAIGLVGSAAANAGAQAEQGAQGFLSFAGAVAQAGIIDPGNLTAGLQQIYNAYQNIGNAIGHTSAYRPSDAYKSAAGLGDSSGSSSSSAQEIDWIEYYYTEIENKIDELNARLENKISNVQALDAKNTIIDQIIDLYDQKQQKLANAVATYDARADYLFSTFSSDIQNKINNGSLDISSISDKELASNIEEYYDYIEAASQARVEAEELKQTIADLAKQKFDNISTAYENEIGLVDAYIDALQDRIDATEARGEQVGASYYEGMIDSAEKRKQSLEEERNALQASLDEAVKLGQVEVGSDTWYEMVNAIYEVDSAIAEAEISIEEYQTAINDLHWENFDKLIDKLENISDELDNIYERLTDNDEAFDENGNWTNQGIAALGMLTQKMEQAQFAAQQYADQIDKLNTDYAAGKYSEEEYNEKLAELTEKQWEAIESYESAKDEIVDLNKARVNAVKDGMQKELDAYKELIDAKKESLEADKDAHDWAKSVAEKEKDILDIQRKLAALANDNSASAMAQKRKLQAELLEAQSDLEESYYDKSIEDQQDALDKEYESYEENQQNEIDSLEEWLDDREQVIEDSFDLVRDNAQVVYEELLNLSQKYGIEISDEIIAPWLAGKDAIGEYKDAFLDPELNEATSAFISQLESVKDKWEETASAAEDAAQRQIDAVRRQQQETVAAYKEMQDSISTITIGSMNNVGYDDSDNGSGSGAGWGSGGLTGGAEEEVKPYSILEIFTNSLGKSYNKFLNDTAEDFDYKMSEAFIQNADQYNQEFKLRVPEEYKQFLQLVCDGLNISSTEGVGIADSLSKVFALEDLPYHYKVFLANVVEGLVLAEEEGLETSGALSAIFASEDVPQNYKDFLNCIISNLNDSITSGEQITDSESAEFASDAIPSEYQSYLDDIMQGLQSPVVDGTQDANNASADFFGSGLPEIINGVFADVEAAAAGDASWASQEMVKSTNSLWDSLVAWWNGVVNSLFGGSSTHTSSSGSIHGGGGGGFVDGTANVNGTAYADGNWGAPKTETALGGELGTELLVRNGRWTTIGEHGAEFFQVRKGDIIFNHQQSKQLLENGRVTGRGKAYASGTWKSPSNRLDDLGEELTICAGPNGGLQFLPKGAAAMATGTIGNLTNLEQFDTTDILNRSRPSIGVSPSVSNNTMEIKIDASVNELIHVDNLDGNNLDEIGKFVDKAWEKKMQTLNSSIKKYTR